MTTYPFRRRADALLSVLAVVLGLIAVAAAAEVGGAPGPLAVRVPEPPAVVPLAERAVFIYELFIWNKSPKEVRLSKVEVLDLPGDLIFTLEGEALLARISHPDDSSDLRLAPGEQAALYLEVPVANDHKSAALRHRLTYTSANVNNTVTGGVTRIDRRPLPVLGPPLRGGPWVAVYAPELARGHRRVYYSVDGVARLPGRFAVDWMRPLGLEQDQTSGAGSDVLVVADGTVVGLRDGVPDPVQGSPDKRIASVDATGNYIAVDIGNERIAFYEHLQPGLLVSRGDRVRRGQVLGKVGMTGQATRPHLHFHLADANSPLGAEGQPYRLRGATVIGQYPSIAEFNEGKAWNAADPTADERRPSFPVANSVIRFPN